MSSLGIGTEANWAALCAGTSGIGRVTRFDVSQFACQIAGEVKGFDPLDFIEKKDVKKMDIFIQYAIAASDFAMKSAAAHHHARAGAAHRRLHRLGHRRVRHHRARAQGVSRRRPAAHLAVLHSLGHHQPRRRPGLDPVRRQGAELGHLHGLLGLGARHRRCLRDHPARRRRRDDCRRLRGGDHADGPRRLRRDARALDAQRRSGAAPAGRSTAIATASSSAKAPACSILEALESRGARGAPIFAELVGYGMSGDAYHITAPSEDGDGGRRVMENALRSAGVAADRTCSTSTRTAPRRRTTIGSRRWRSSSASATHAYKLAVSSTKSMHGHLLGAAGGLEAGISALAIHHQMLPPTINLDHPDEGCDLDYVPHTGAAGVDRPTRCRTRSGSAAPTPRCCSEVECTETDLTSDRPEERLRPFAHEDCRLSEAGRDPRWPVRVDEAETLDSRRRRQLRAERARRLRARRSAAAEGAARRRGHRLLGRAGARHAGAARGAGARRRSRAARRRRRAGARRCVRASPRRWPPRSRPSRSISCSPACSPTIRASRRSA